MTPAFQAALTVVVGGGTGSWPRRAPVFGSISRFVRVVPVSNGMRLPSGPAAETARPSAMAVRVLSTSNWSSTAAAVAGRGS